MTFDILLVEDEPGWAAAIRDALSDVSPAISLTHATSRDGAFALLDAGEYDLLICDLRLPAEDGGLGTAEEHGFAVHERARRLCPGTPCFFLTGFGTLANMRAALAEGEVADLFGDGSRYPLVRQFDKRDLPECVDAIVEFLRSYRALHDVQVDGDLSERDTRALQVFARRHDAIRISVRRLSGGLSSARTVMLRMTGSNDTDLRGAAFAKLDLTEVVANELSRYQQALPPFLEPGAYAPHAGEVMAGIGKQGAVFYTLADGFDANLFQVLRDDPARAAQVVNELRRLLQPWLHMEAHELMTIDAFRVVQAANDRIADFVASLQEFGQLDFESKQVELRTCNQHGDLHGANVLVNNANHPLLIDYGDVGLHPAGLDPVVLELSLLFHPDSPARGSALATPRHAAEWVTVDRYANGTPYEEFIKACRKWSIDCAGAEQVSVLAYAHAVRQLRYPDTDKDLALAVAGSCIRGMS
jgi:CheY-like chemotaxis protein